MSLRFRLLLTWINIEAWGLGMFMVAAGVVVTLLESPKYPGVEMIPDAFMRRAIIGIAMGLTAIATSITISQNRLSE